MAGGIFACTFKFPLENYEGVPGTGASISFNPRGDSKLNSKTDGGVGSSSQSRLDFRVAVLSQVWPLGGPLLGGERVEPRGRTESLIQTTWTEEIVERYRIRPNRSTRGRRRAVDGAPDETANNYFSEETKQPLNGRAGDRPLPVGTAKKKEKKNAYLIRCALLTTKMRTGST